MESNHLQGLRVGALESRMAREMESLIRRYGGIPTVAPSMEEIPLDQHPEVERFGQDLLAGNIDILLLLTGVGTRSMIQILEKAHPIKELLEALGRATLLVRGPKPAAVLRELGLTATLTVPEPNTWKDILQTLDRSQDIQGLRLAVQEYGVSNPDLLEGLRERGAKVLPVPIYRWALPKDTAPIKHLLRAIIEGQIDMVLVTNAVQIDHVFKLLNESGQADQFRQACDKIIIGSIGPTASERLHSYGLPVDFEPSHSKMGILVKEISELAHSLLQTKRSA